MKDWTPEEIRSFRKSLGLFQREFGDMLGVTGRYIAMLEAGDEKPSKTMRALLECLIERQEWRKGKGVKKKHGKRDIQV